MGDRPNKDHDHLSGVKCVVNTCHYHCPGDLCSANCIEIQHRHATTSEETDCATFVPK